MSRLKWPDKDRYEFHFGPLIIVPQMIEPFIIPKVFCGLSYDEIHEIQFDSDYERAEFVHMLGFYPDCRSEQQFDKTFGDFEKLRKLISIKADEDGIDRRKEYSSSCEVCNENKNETWLYKLLKIFGLN